MTPGRVTSILVVEDDEAVRFLIRDELAVDGHQIWLAADAGQAVDVMQSGVSIDFVLTDVKMPGSMDGLALAEWITRRYPGLAVAVTSATRRDALWRMGMREDQLFFRKPIRFEELRRCIGERCGTAPTRGDNAGLASNPDCLGDDKS